MRHDAKFYVKKRRSISIVVNNNRAGPMPSAKWSKWETVSEHEGFAPYEAALKAADATTIDETKEQLGIFFRGKGYFVSKNAAGQTIGTFDGAEAIERYNQHRSWLRRKR